MPGASPETVAATVATPLERHLGIIADVAEMTSQSTVGTTWITLQFGLNRNIDGAAHDVQAAINAARANLPTSLPRNPAYRKVNPAGPPIAILEMTSDTLTQGQIYDAASTSPMSIKAIAATTTYRSSVCGSAGMCAASRSDPSRDASPRQFRAPGCAAIASEGRDGYPELAPIAHRKALFTGLAKSGLAGRRHRHRRRPRICSDPRVKPHRLRILNLTR